MSTSGPQDQRLADLLQGLDAADRHRLGELFSSLGAHSRTDSGELPGERLDVRIGYDEIATVVHKWI